MKQEANPIINMFRDSPWPGNVLSNFASTPFKIDGISCTCSEAFIQSLKCSNTEEQIEFCSLSGQEAWEKGAKLTDRVFMAGNIWWLGTPYVLHSEQHFEVVKRGLFAKFSQSEIARGALLASGNAMLIHDYGQLPGKNQSLPVEVFCKIVSGLRAEFLGWQKA